MLTNDISRFVPDFVGAKYLFTIKKCPLLISDEWVVCLFVEFVNFSITLTYRIIVQQILLFFCKIPTCMSLFHPARLLILGNFEPKPYFSLVKNEKFQPARPYSILHVY